MGRRLIRIATAAAAGVMGAFTGVGAATAAPVQTELADLSNVSLAEAKTTDNSVLANSLRRAVAETGDDSGLFAGFSAAPPAALGN
ncbi:hypothetical protein ABGB07_33190 [Micromonosporaceae bacterium B7E4]